MTKKDIQEVKEEIIEALSDEEKLPKKCSECGMKFSFKEWGLSDCKDYQTDGKN